MPRSTRGKMSRRAVSWEHFANFAHVDVVQAADVHAKATRNRRPDLLHV
jgi:hypothetical protein